MKLLFSEAKADYTHYIFPYAIWAFPENQETPGDLFNHGFLPSSRNLDRFYLCRQVRINLKNFTPSSENRRILRKGEGITVSLIPRSEFDYTEERRQFYKNYADIKFGKDIMGLERLDSLFQAKSPLTSCSSTTPPPAPRWARPPCTSSSPKTCLLLLRVLRI